MLFAKIVPNCKKLGLLDAGDGWLRQKFTELGVSVSRTGPTLRGVRGVRLGRGDIQRLTGCVFGGDPGPRPGVGRPEVLGPGSSWPPRAGAGRGP